MTKTDVTLVVVPRERFSYTRESLESIYEHTPGLAQVVYVDGASPAPVRRYIAEQAAARGFLHVRTDRYVSPNAARNIGLRYVRTPFVVFVDNDVIVTPQWLEHLLACARETGAAIVGPLYHVDIGGRKKIHMAGGDVKIVTENGKRVCLETHFCRDLPLHAAPRFERRPSDVVEFHTMLVRTDVFAATGPLDEGLMSMHEHADFCMAARALGHGIYLEPESVVTYVPAMRLAASDLPYFMLRWSEHWTRSSIERFNTKWKLDPGHPVNQHAQKFARHHRCRGMRLIYDGAKKTRTTWFRERALVLAERCINVAYTAVRPVRPAR